MDVKIKEERRKFARVEFSSSLDLSFGKKNFKDCKTKNISVNGAFIEGIEGPKVGDQGKGTFLFIGPSSKLMLELKTEVVRTEEEGIALQFYDVDNDCFCHLMNIVYLNYQKRDGIDGKSFSPDQIEDFKKKPPKVNESFLEKIEEEEDDYDDDLDDYEDDIFRNIGPDDSDEYDD